MPKYRVRQGQQLPHEGKVYEYPSLVTLPRRLAREFPHLVDEVDDAGKPLTSPREEWEIALETIRDHERISILELERQAAAARVADVADAADRARKIADEADQELATATAMVARIDVAIAEEQRRLAEEDAARESKSKPSRKAEAPSAAGPSAAPASKE